MRSSSEDSGDKAQTSSTEEVEIVATQASQGASQLDRSLSDMLASAYGDDCTGSAQASGDGVQGGDSTGSAQASGDGVQGGDSTGSA